MTENKTQEMRKAVKKLIQKKDNNWKVVDEEGILSEFYPSRYFLFEIIKKTKRWEIDDCITPEYRENNKNKPYWVGHTGKSRGLSRREFKTLPELIKHIELMINWIEDGYKKGLFSGGEGL